MPSDLGVYNHDIVGLYNRMNRFLVELQKSQSSSLSKMVSFDQYRLVSYLDALDTYHAWVVGQPQLDLPETTPRFYSLEAGPEIVDTESEEVNDAVRLLVLARDELINSQSARQGSGMVSFDSVRLTAVIEKTRQFLVTYIQVATPLDQPESSPMKPVTGPGLGGV